MSSTKAWGPAAGWPSLDTLQRNLHTLASGSSAPPDIDTTELIEAWRLVLPCGACRDSSGSFIHDEGIAPPEDAYDADAMARWVYDLHNRVNRKKRDNKMDVTPAPPFETYKEAVLDGGDVDEQEATDVFWNLVLPYALSYEPRETEKKQHIRNFAKYAKYFLPMTTPENDDPLSELCDDKHFRSRQALFYCVLRQSPYMRHAPPQRKTGVAVTMLAKYLAAKSTSCTKKGCA